MDQKSPIWDIAVTLVRIVLGLALVFASIEKLADLSLFAVSITRYRIISGIPALSLATVLPWVELLAGFCLIFGLFIRGSSLLAFVMLLGFTLAVASALLRGLDISCGCYTQNPSAGHIGWQKIGENFLLILVSILLFLRPDSRFTLERLNMRLPVKSLK